jgi:hypothetical protein
VKKVLFDIVRRLMPGSWRRAARKVLFGDANPDEIALIGKILDRPGLMVDVGAHFGGACEPFLHRGWKVLAFEPDAENRAMLNPAAEDFQA